MTDWSADPWFAQHAWVAPRVGETRRSGFKALRPHSTSTGRRKRTAKLQNPTQESNPRERIDEGFLWSSKIVRPRPPPCPIRSQRIGSRGSDHRVAFDRRRFYQAVAFLAAVCAYATIVLGGTVRGMDAGLACLDWPL